MKFKTGKKFHLMHCIHGHHGLNGYKEIIDTIYWGLENLGYEVSYGINTFKQDSTNIVFGAQILPIENLNLLPKDTIIYNFEQLRGLEPSQIRPEIHFYAKHFKVWDYSNDHLKAWENIRDAEVKIVPVGYAPVLKRISKPLVQDIDVLIYGMPGYDRLNAFAQLSHAGLISVFICGLYGEARDSLIARSKIILNINLYEASKIFEIVRVSYLLANKKAIVATLDPETSIDEDIKTCLKCSTNENIVNDCLELIENASIRLNLEHSGFETFSKRNISTILQQALN